MKVYCCTACLGGWVSGLFPWKPNHGVKIRRSDFIVKMAQMHFVRVTWWIERTSKKGHGVENVEQLISCAAGACVENVNHSQLHPENHHNWKSHSDPNAGLGFSCMGCYDTIQWNHERSKHHDASGVRLLLNWPLEPPGFKIHFPFMSLRNRPLFPC